jgi:hypothetical protein
MNHEVHEDLHYKAISLRIFASLREIFKEFYEFHTIIFNIGLGVELYAPMVGFTQSHRESYAEYAKVIFHYLPEFWIRQYQLYAVRHIMLVEIRNIQD